MRESGYSENCLQIHSEFSGEAKRRPKHATTCSYKKGSTSDGSGRVGTGLLGRQSIVYLGHSPKVTSSREESGEGRGVLQAD